MATFDTVRTAIQRLAPRGWRQLFALHGLDLNAGNLPQELSRPLVNGAGVSTIDLTQPGFEDFCTAGTAAISPGNPPLSLLYHALASPDVYPVQAGARTDDDFATLNELDAIENYIYAMAQKKLSDFSNPVIAVFACQYRAGGQSVHAVHADTAYSRTGISRAGTAPMHYDPLRRSFWGAPAGGLPGVAVMPSRFAAFIAEKRKISSGTLSVIGKLNGPVTGDNAHMFLVPVHKLFEGTECLVGENIQGLTFSEYHRSEKLRKIHQLSPAEGGVAPLPGFNINLPPFIRESRYLVKLQAVGASTLVIPLSSGSLVETTTQHNSITGVNEIVRFKVPPDDGKNRFLPSTLLIRSTVNEIRAASEYVHIRLHVQNDGQLFDVNTMDDADFVDVLKSAKFSNNGGVVDGPLTAAHLLDNSCEGVVGVNAILSQQLIKYPAVSFVAAPDFLPLVSQLSVQRWSEKRGLDGLSVFFAQGGPEPLCYGRNRTPNPALVDPLTHSAPAFVRNDVVNKTICAVLSRSAQAIGPQLPEKVSVTTSYLPDNAANVFQPGWDTALDKDNLGQFYANYGLGSPFPEDAKLCAALNSFWPAAAPDVGRTFGRQTALPLLDAELGLHPNHPNVLASQASSAPGWDGEFGPFFLSSGKVNFASIVRSDYSVSASLGKIGMGMLGAINALELAARMDAFRECADRIRGATAMKDFVTLLVTAEKVEDWSQRMDRFANTLTGSGYLMVFADIGAKAPDPNDVRRVIGTVTNKFVCQITRTLVGLKKGALQPSVTPWLH